MSNKQKRLQEVYDYLRRWYGIHTQTDFANSMRYSRNAISLALNGNEKYLTDSLFKNICEAYPGVFDLDYLLTGEGQLLTIEEEVHNEDHERLYNPQPIDQSSLVNALLAAKDQLIEELKEKYDKMEAEKDARIAELKQLAEERLHRIAELRRVIDANEINPSNYPFTVGVADTKKHKHV